VIERGMRELDAGYAAEVDAMDEQTWCQILQLFDDANIYQTWAYEAVRCGRANVSHLSLRRRGDIVAIAQARLIKLPFLDVGIAYVRWGPLWRRRDAEGRAETFRQAIRALRNEYACRRRLVVRVFPLLFDDGSGCFSSILNEEGFSWLGKEERDRTLLIDLSLPLQELRNGLRPHWRRQLKRAEGSGLEIVEGSDDLLLERFSKIYGEMEARKGLVKLDDFDQLRAIQRLLPEEFKMNVLLCRSGDTPCAGLIWSAIGETGIYLFGATSDRGMMSRGSYLLHWKLIERLKQDPRLTVYDLNGISPERNPGTYRFKTDLCGRNGRDAYFLGRFDSYPNVLSYSGVACGDTLRTIYRALRRTSRAGLALLDPLGRRRAVVVDEDDAGNGSGQRGVAAHRPPAAEAGGRFARR